MADETLKEFLVSIGFKVDEAGHTRFTEALEGATLRGNLLADVIVEAMKKVVDATGQIFEHLDATAKGMERVYNSVQHLNAESGLKATTTGMMAFVQAFKDMGDATGGAERMLQSFAERLTSVQGARKWIQESFHIDKLPDDPGQALIAVWGAIAKDPRNQFIAPFISQYLGGVTPEQRQTLQGLPNAAGQTLQGQFREHLEEQERAGLTPEKVAAAAKASVVLGEAMDKLTLAFTSFEVDVINYLEPRIKEFDGWLKDHPTIQSMAPPVAGMVASGPLGGFGTGGHVESLEPSTQEGFNDWNANRSPWALWRRFRNWISGGGANPIGAAHGEELPAPQQQRRGPGQWLADQFSGAARFIGIGSQGAEVSSANPLPVKIMSIDPQANAMSGGPLGIGGQFLGTGAATSPISGGPDVGGANWGHSGAGGTPSGIRARSIGGTPTGTEAGLAKQAYDYWRGQGLTDEQALSVLGNQRGENALGALTTGDAGRSVGQFQWSATRRAQILAGTGIDVLSAGFLDQQKAARWEMENSPDSANRVWESLKSARTQGEQMGVLVHQYERSANQANDIAIREGYAERYRRLHLGGGEQIGVSAPAIRDIGIQAHANDEVARYRRAHHGMDEWQLGGSHPHPLIGHPLVDRRAHLLEAAGRVSTAGLVGPPLVDRSAHLLDAAGRISTAGLSSNNLSQTNSITINAPDPHTAAAMVGLHLDRNAADISRNLQGAAQ